MKEIFNKVLRLSFSLEFKQTEWKNGKKEVKKREESRNEFVAEKSLIMTQVGTLVYSASEELDVGILIIFIWIRKQFRTCSKTKPKLIPPL